MSGWVFSLLTEFNKSAIYESNKNSPMQEAIINRPNDNEKKLNHGKGNNNVYRPIVTKQSSMHLTKNTMRRRGSD